MATLLSTFTEAGRTIAATPEDVAARTRNSYEGIFVVLAMTDLGAWLFSTAAWKQWSATRAAADFTPLSLTRRRTLMKRWAILIGLVVLVCVAVLIPIVQRQLRHQQLVAAIDRNQPDSVPEIKRLVEAGADITTRGHDNTVAMVAAFWDDSNLLKQALEAGLDPNATDSFGNAALHFAGFAPSVEPTKLLLAVGAKVGIQNTRGETPLMIAVRNAQFDQIKLLLQAGARVDVTSQSGETAISIAQSLQPGGPRPMRPDLTTDDFVRLLKELPRNPKK